MTFKELIKDIYLKLVAKGDYKAMPTSLDGHYPILGKKNFYKVALDNKGFFKFEKENYRFLKKYPQISKFLPNYIYRINYFKTDILTPINDKSEHLKYAEEILNSFKLYGKYDFITLDEMEYLKSGIEIISKVFNFETADKCREKICHILSRDMFRIGVCHGDFHPKNVLKFKDKPVMIDFDCVRKKSIQEFDAIYFVIQSLIDYDDVIWWHQAIEADISSYNDFLSEFVGNMEQFEDLMFLYLVDRIGQDFKYEKNLDKVPVGDIESNLRMFKIL